MTTDRILRLPEVLDVTGLGRSTVYRLISLGEFPRQRAVYGNVAGWLQSEVQAWIRSRPVAAVSVGDREP